jgi:hypothetical protein
MSNVMPFPVVVDFSISEVLESEEAPQFRARGRFGVNCDSSGLLFHNRDGTARCRFLTIPKKRTRN